MGSSSEPSSGFVRASRLYDAAEGTHTVEHVRLRADWAVATTKEVRRP